MTNLERRMQHKRLQGLCTKRQLCSQTEGKDTLNRCDFRCVLKVENVRDRRRSTGILLQAYGPSTARARSPIIERRVAGTRASAVDAECSRRCESTTRCRAALRWGRLWARKAGFSRSSRMWASTLPGADSNSNVVPLIGTVGYASFPFVQWDWFLGAILLKWLPPPTHELEAGVMTAITDILRRNAAWPCSFSRFDSSTPSPSTHLIDRH